MSKYLNFEPKYALDCASAGCPFDFAVEPECQHAHAHLPPLAARREAPR